MSAVEEGPSKCSRKTALSVFFAFELFAFTFSLIALLSPSWQYVYLENGRTEHHHGLWLDCKRDYSHEYGRTREYYETLYRLDKQSGPFDQFFLPSLNCVYKFDYYIDTEDLYDHNHDENRLQDDANQHLFLAWKVAALAALGLALLSSGAALLLSICAFCHRTLICASTVLVSISAFLSTIGLLVFYIWANYQDNNIIKEDDAVYQQYFGWAVYLQAIGTVLHYLASFLGCIATSVAFHKGKAKLVKIEVLDGDSSTLLYGTPSQQFKRSFSAIYKVDSAALRRWEKDYMSKCRPQSTTKEANFKRAASMPNVKKGRRSRQLLQNSSNLSRSSTNIFAETSSGVLTATTNTFDSSYRKTALSPTKLASKSSLKQSMPMPSDDHDVTYEYMPCDGIYFNRIPPSSEAGMTCGRRSGVSHLESNLLETSLQATRGVPETSINVYDKVYEHLSNAASSIPDEYEQPNSIRARNSLSSLCDEFSASRNCLRPISPLSGSTKSADVMRIPAKSTLIDDVANDRPSTADPTSLVGRRQANSPEFCTSSEVLQLRGSDWRVEDKREMSRKLASEYREVIKRPPVPPKKPVASPRASPPKEEKNIKDFAVQRKDTTCFTNRAQESQNPEPDSISINTFNVGTFSKKEGQRSITNLTFQPCGSESIEAFERPESTDLSSVNRFLVVKDDKPTPLMKKFLWKSDEAEAARSGHQSGHHRSYIDAIPDEVERSVGSSPSLKNYTTELDTHLREAELRLNLFMNGVAPLTVVESVAASSTKESSGTTV
uniref:Clc-like protein n=1 Tax=Parascaris univalens TaxID=6257 RepID=A0A915BFJ0_PARUN